MFLLTMSRISLITVNMHPKLSQGKNKLTITVSLQWQQRFIWQRPTAIAKVKMIENIKRNSFRTRGRIIAKSRTSITIANGLHNRRKINRVITKKCLLILYLIFGMSCYLSITFA